MLQGFSPQNSLNRRVYGRSQRRPSRTRAASCALEIPEGTKELPGARQDVMSSAKGLPMSVPTVTTMKDSGLPSWLGTACDTPSQEFFAKTVVRLKQAAIAIRTETIRLCDETNEEA